MVEVEASKVLSTLCRGPPPILHGSLVHNLQELQRKVKLHFLDQSNSNSSENENENEVPVTYLFLDDNGVVDSVIGGNDNNGSGRDADVGERSNNDNGDNDPEEKTTNVDVGHVNSNAGKSESGI